MADVDLYEAGAHELLECLANGSLSSVDLTKAYLARIAEVNGDLRAVVTLNPRALEIAAEKDADRAALAPTAWPPLLGLCVLLKDNIATGLEDGMDCTAGSYALKGAIRHEDAPLVRRLKDAGAVILGKTSMTQLAAMRDWTVGHRGWSTVSGQAKYGSDGVSKPLSHSLGLPTTRMATRTALRRDPQ
jgi:amidase